MIHRIVYGGKGKTIEGGKETEVQLRPAAVLAHTGPFLQVEIRPPLAVIRQLETDSKPIPSIQVRALIDTGAAFSVVTPDVAREAGMIHTGYVDITSVQNTQRQPVYFGTIWFPWNRAKEAPIAVCPLKTHRCLIGRDVLQHWYLTYDGANGTIVICD